MNLKQKGETGGKWLSNYALPGIAMVLLAFLATIALNSVHAFADDGAADLASSSDAVAMNRLYNPYSGEHFYTADSAEKEKLVTLGWKSEGVGWLAPTSGDKVYRLYNPYSGDHHYTLSKEENDQLDAIGWNAEGVGWFSAPSSTGVPLYRQYNPYCTGAGSHNYTVSEKENKDLVALGWQAEGIAWYGVEDNPSKPITTNYTVTFNSNGGSYVAPQTVRSGQTASWPSVPTKKGYTFECWCSDSALTKAFSFSTPITTNTLLYAKWTQDPVSYKVTFETNCDTSVESQTIESGKAVTKPADPIMNNNVFVAWFKDKDFTMPFNFNDAITSNLTLYAKWQSDSLPTQIPPESCCAVYRLINQSTGLYFFTTSDDEIDSKVKDGWVNEGVAWYAPQASNTPVYRCFNPKTEIYQLTTDKLVYENLGKSGWMKEGVVFYSDDSKAVAVYQLSNPFSGDHFYTSSTEERETYVNSGWQNEGVACYRVEDKIEAFAVPAELYSDYYIPIYVRSSLDSETFDFHFEDGKNVNTCTTSFEPKPDDVDFDNLNGTIVYVALKKAGIYKLHVNSSLGGEAVFTLNVNHDAEIDENAYIDGLITQLTNDSMDSFEKMEAIQSYLWPKMKYSTCFKNENGNSAGYCYLLKEWFSNPWWKSFVGNSYTTPAILCKIAEKIGGFSDVHNCYFDYPVGEGGWYDIHYYCKCTGIDKTGTEKTRYYQICPSSETNLVDAKDASELPKIDFNDTSQFTELTKAS